MFCFSHTKIFKKFENYVKKSESWIENNKGENSMTSTHSDEKPFEDDNFNLNEFLKTGKSFRSSSLPSEPKQLLVSFSNL